MASTSANANRPKGNLGKALRELVPEAEAREFQAGEVIFTAGDVGDGFYVIDRGEVRISAVVAQNEARVLARIGPGDFFGEMAVIDDVPRSATATAEVPTRALFIGRARLLQLLERRPELALILIREFSERMRTLNQKYVDEIIQAERLATVGRFAGTIVHDFKNPLTVIGLAAEMGLQDGAPAALRQKAQSRIARQVQRISNMLHELIDFTRPSGEKPQLRRMDFAAFMNPLAEELAQEIADRRVELVMTGPPPAIAVDIEPQRLSRLFYNLINNAVDEMSGGGKIFLGFEVADGRLAVSIRDTGKGIAPEIAQSLFRPFATHGKARGTGLGLSICKKIVEDHGGSIRADSIPGQGATFTFTLPLPA